MSPQARVPVAVAVAALLIGGLLPANVQALPASAFTRASLSVEARRGPVLMRTFWSVILRMVITVSRHASSRMVARGVSEGTLKRVLNDGRVVGRSGGVTRLRWGAYEARVNSTTGNVITVVRIGSGGGGR